MEGHSPDVKMRHSWSRWFDRRRNRQQMHLLRTILLLAFIGFLGPIASKFL